MFECQLLLLWLSTLWLHNWWIVTWPNCWRLWIKRYRTKLWGYRGKGLKRKHAWMTQLSLETLDSLKRSKEDLSIYTNQSHTHQYITLNLSKFCQESASLGKIGVKWNKLRQIQWYTSLLPQNIFLWMGQFGPETCVCLISVRIRIWFACVQRGHFKGLVWVVFGGAVQWGITWPDPSVITYRSYH